MISLKTTEEIEIMRQGGDILARVLYEVAQEARAGVSLKTLDNLAEKLIVGYGARPSFKGYRQDNLSKAYPASLCVSLNYEVVHGVPDERMLKKGDVVSLDAGVFYNGFHNDSALTLAVGEVTTQAKELIWVAKKALELAIEKIKPGRAWGDIAYSIKKYVMEAGFDVVRELTGHGIGRQLQEDPSLPNFGRKGDEPLLKEGMVIAVEPMVVAGRPEVEIGLDGFVYQTKDKSLSAHFEHTIAVTKNGALALTQL